MGSERSASASGYGRGSQASTSNRCLGAKALLEASEEVYTSFNPARLTIDAHSDAYISQHRINNKDDDTFIRQVLYGTVRYRKLILAFTNAFYHDCSGTALRGDIHLYSIFTYLAVLRLQELTFPQFR